MGGFVLLPMLVVLFVTWVGTVFLTLFQLRKIGDGARYGGQPGLRATLSSFRIFLRQPEWRNRRHLLMALTLAMIGLNVLLYQGGAAD